MIFFAEEGGTRLCKQIKSPDGSSLLTKCDRFVGQTLRSFVAHPELLKSPRALLGDVCRFRTQVKFEVDVGEI